MRNSLRLLFISVLLALSVLAFSAPTDAWYGYGMYPAYASTYSYGAYGSSYGYAGPYSYHFVPHSFWGTYYNPGLYYSTLDYSLRNNQYAFSQNNLAMTYGFINSNRFS